VVFSRYQQEPPPPLVQYEAVRQSRESAEVLCPGARKVKFVVSALFETEARLRRNHQSSLIIDSHFEEKINGQNTYELKGRLSGGNYREASGICECGPGLHVDGFGHVGCGTGAC
jgi:hypothetical protein